MKAFLITVLLALSAGVLAAGASDDAMNAFHGQVSEQLDQWFQDGEFPVILQTERIRVDMEPTNYEWVTDLGWMYGNLEDPGHELSVYRAFEVAAPGDPDSCFPEANFFFSRRSYVHTLALLKPAVAMARHPQPNAYRELAHSYTYLGLFQEALDIWDIYIKLAPQDLAAVANRKKVVERMNGAPGSPEPLADPLANKRKSAPPKGGG